MQRMIVCPQIVRKPCRHETNLHGLLIANDQCLTALMGVSSPYVTLAMPLHVKPQICPTSRLSPDPPLIMAWSACRDRRMPF